MILYKFGQYNNIDRWSSYWHQIDEILKCSPKNMLEIGIGDKVVGSYLKNNFLDISYTSFDNNKDLDPDFFGSIEKTEFSDNSFDLVCAFEVMEHLPYEKFLPVLAELHRISKKNVIISLPHWGRHFSFELRLPYFKKIRGQFKLDLFPINHVFDGQHYWEIGKKGYPIENIRSKIKETQFKILEDYIVFETPYHHFFILEKNN
jgi:hypothetical protein